ncbi:MORN repeat-containing protein 3 [Mytilus edulis]|uniref:MORN repeat-containing protein 3 n=1 Tax=Mytilus edulis TaxID=6550 RepID=A0A8S3UKT7_MYTED|nr:MORN repeat-containing protein 3 [Mytilus edulis]
MPHLKEPKEKEPLWKEWDYLAQKKGIRHTVYSVNGDQFTGEWLDNKKDGKGTYKWKENGAIYDGDWKKGKRNGFGTYSVPKPNNGYRKEYSGGWKNDMRHGYGTQFYGDNEYYEGEWYADKRSGWGRMYFSDGTIYEGEWFDDQRNGQGMVRLRQVYEGVWKDDIAKCGNMRDFDREGAPEPTKYPIPDVKLLNAESVLQEAEEQFLQDHD